METFCIFWVLESPSIFLVHLSTTRFTFSSQRESTGSTQYLHNGSQVCIVASKTVIVELAPNHSGVVFDDVPMVPVDHTCQASSKVVERGPFEEFLPYLFLDDLFQGGIEEQTSMSPAFLVFSPNSFKSYKLVLEISKLVDVSSKKVYPFFAKVTSFWRGRVLVLALLSGRNGLNQILDMVGQCQGASNSNDKIIPISNISNTSEDGVFRVVPGRSESVVRDSGKAFLGVLSFVAKEALLASCATLHGFFFLRVFFTLDCFISFSMKQSSSCRKILHNKERRTLP